ncbi:MAG: chromosomal replication initiator protein DnaA [Bacteroidia bacterium]|nr:chromosomal replication initiator protein DnaA [Bacteroidia bacterium]
MPAPNHREVWEHCLNVIRDNIPVQSFRTWFEPIEPLSLENNVLTIQVPSQFFYEWIEEHYIGLLRRTVRHFLGADAKLEYSVIVENSSVASETPVSVQMPATTNETRPTNPPVNLPLNTGKSIPNPFVIPGLKKVSINPQLNTYYTFDSYIEGECNRLARTAGLAVANRPGQTAFNPLLLYGGVGLGKTHLAQAIGNEVKRQHPSKVVLYVSSEKFTNQFVDSIKNNSVSDFISFYQLVDVLIVDDIQFFAGKERTQDIFFHVFNHLHQTDRQLILTSDAPPNDLKGMEERLLSRFKWGLSADLQSPDLETRIAILKNKMYHEGIDIPDDVVEYIAYNITSNIRELEGALISILAQSSFNRREIDMDLAHQIVKNFVKNASRELSIDSIQKIVSEYFRLPVEKLKEKTRKREIVQARQISMFFAKQYTKSSLKTIGLHFGGRDHSTVIHALHTVDDLMTTDKEFRRYVEEIRKKIQLSTS